MTYYTVKDICRDYRKHGFESYEACEAFMLFEKRREEKRGF